MAMQEYVNLEQVDEFVEVTVKINLRLFVARMVDDFGGDLPQFIDIDAIKQLIKEDVDYRVSMSARGLTGDDQLLDYLSETGYDGMLEG